MEYKPVLFSTPMVQAILEGRKTQTRRQIKFDFTKHYLPNCDNKIEYFLGGWGCKRCGLGHADNGLKPKYERNDILWVRETWQHTDILDKPNADGFSGFIYRASKSGMSYENYIGWKWKPSIFMPKEATRIFLKVTNVRVERLQDISESDANSEGVMDDEDFPSYSVDYTLCPVCGGQGVHGAFGENYGLTEVDCSDCNTYKKRFKHLWHKINGNWDENPFVWVYEFERIEKPKNLNDGKN